MSGWIKIHRTITDHWLYKEKRVFSKFEAWNDILLNVNYSDSKTIIKGKIYHVQRGESLLSFESWGKRWNWEKSKVRRFLKLLQSDNMIELKTDTTTTHLIVCNYASYQDERNTNATQTQRKRNANATQMQPIKEEKEEKEINNAISFDVFWNIYGKKSDKAKCLKAWLNIHPHKHGLIYEQARKYVESTPDSKYRKNPLTWLNGKCWEDEITTQSTTKIVDPLVEYCKKLGIQ